MLKNEFTLEDQYSADKFCFSVVKADFISPNEYANIKNGSIYVNLSLIKNAPNDAAIAAVLPHEIAHVTMNHRNLDYHQKVLAEMEILATYKEEIEQSIDSLYKMTKIKLIRDIGRNAKNISEAGYPQLVEDINEFYGNDFLFLIGQYYKRSISRKEYYQFLFSSLKFMSNEFTKISMDIISLDQVWEDTYYQAKSIVKSIHQLENLYNSEQARLDELELEFSNWQDDIISNGQFASKSWKEEEADNVGLEIYYWAGYEWSSYHWFNSYFLSDINSCLLDYQESRVLPSRGPGAHPTPCWRFLNIHYTELEAHEEYLPWSANLQISEESPALSALKNLIDEPYNEPRISDRLTPNDVSDIASISISVSEDGEILMIVDSTTDLYCQYIEVSASFSSGQPGIYVQSLKEIVIPSGVQHIFEIGKDFRNFFNAKYSSADNLRYHCDEISFLSSTNKKKI